MIASWIYRYQHKHYTFILIRKEQSKQQYSNKCKICNIDAYKQIAHYYEQDRITSKKNYEYIDTLSNNYKKIMKEEAEKILGRLNWVNRMLDKLRVIQQSILTFFYLTPLIYAVAVTLVTAVRRKAIRNDMIIAVSSIGKTIIAIFNAFKWLIEKASSLSRLITNTTVSIIVKWVITILIIVILIAVVLITGFIVSNLLSKLIEKYKNKLSKYLDKIFLSVVLVDLGAIVFCGDIIRSLFPINLVITYLIILLAFIGLRVIGGLFYVKIYIKK